MGVLFVLARACWEAIKVGVLFVTLIPRTQEPAQQGGLHPRAAHATGPTSLGAQTADAEMVATAPDCLAAPAFSMADALHAILARNLHSLAAGQGAQGPILI